MQIHICSRCGETLKKDGELFKCGHCGATYSGEREERSAAELKKALDDLKIERLANGKRLLWAATHEKYPSKEAVCEAARNVLAIHAEDYLANIYLHSHDRDPQRLNKILATSEVSPSEASETFRWLLPSLSSRTVGPLHDFIDRHFRGDERTRLDTELESEAAKISQGIYEPALPREVFLCYSSRDMGKVVGIMDVLEQNGFMCFAAFRNLRHGKGAQENYLDAIYRAMKACAVVVFLSSEASRSMECDALKVELPHMIDELPGKPRVEYILEDYGDTPFMVRRTLKAAFPEQEQCRDLEDLMVRVSEAIKGAKPKKEAKEKLLAEEEAKRKAEEEAKRKAAEEEAEKKLKKDFDLIEVEGGYAIEKYKGKGPGVVIPPTYNGKPIASIGNSAFHGCESLKFVKIHASVT
nr:hypothetical protein [Bacilli bacterium]